MLRIGSVMKRGSADDEVELVIGRQAITDIEANKARLREWVLY